MRDRALDVAKGLAITGIVASHVLRGLVAGDLLDPWQPWYEEIDTAFYLAHLGVFFLLAGAFVGRSVSRMGEAAYLRRRLGLLAWLFVLWTVIQGGFQVLSARVVNTPIGVGDVAAGLIRPLGQLWFLPTLAVFTLATVLMAPWRSELRRWLTLALATAVSLTWWGYSYPWFGTHGPAMSIFFVVGVVVGDERLRRWLHARSTWAVGLVAAVVYAGVIWAADPIAPSEFFPPLPRDLTTVGLGVVASIAGVLAVLVVSRLVANVPVISAAFARIGAQSLAIFLAHIIVAAGLRVALIRLGLDDVGVLVVVLTAAGVALPMVAASVAPRLGLGWLFATPRWWQRLWRTQATTSA